MMNEHVSALTLDSLAIGALDAEAEARTAAHLASCADCRAEQTAAAALREHFAVHVLPRTHPESRRSWRWALVAAPALAAAILLLVIMRDRGGPDDELGIKGDATWQVFANRNGETFAVHDGSNLAAGDRIRFVVTPNGAPYVLVASVDGAGAASIYYPYGGTQSGPTHGARNELPGSIVLDAAPGPERLYAIFSDDPITADSVTEQLRMIGVRGADAIRHTRSLDVPSRAQASLVFEKAAP
jgi:hypothetical protein